MWAGTLSSGEQSTQSQAGVTLEWGQLCQGLGKASQRPGQGQDWGMRRAGLWEQGLIPQICVLGLMSG